MLNYFADLHCDTLWRCYEQRLDLSHPSLQVKEHNSFHHLQNYGIYIPDSVGDSLAYFRRVYNHGKRLFDSHPQYVQCRNAKEIATAFDEGKTPYLISIEGGCFFNDSNSHNLAVVKELKEKGIAFVSLCYNKGNRLAGGILTPHLGLSATGKNAALLLREWGISVDISHLNHRSADEMLDLLPDGVVATHSNCFSLVDHPRNLTDDQIKELASKKGLIGLNFYPPFLSGKAASSYDVLRHLEHLEKLGAMESIAFGSDFDGMESNPSDLCSTDDLPTLYENLFHKVGDRARRYCFDNVMSYLERHFK